MHSTLEISFHDCDDFQPCSNGESKVFLIIIIPFEYRNNSLSAFYMYSIIWSCINREEFKYFHIKIIK